VAQIKFSLGALASTYSAPSPVFAMVAATSPEMLRLFDEIWVPNQN